MISGIRTMMNLTIQSSLKRLTKVSSTSSSTGCRGRDYRSYHSITNSNKNYYKFFHSRGTTRTVGSFQHSFIIQPPLRRREDDDNNDRSLPRSYDCNKNTSCTRRMYHNTTKQEIVPIIIVGGVLIGFGIHYSYRAIQRMKQEEEEYYIALQTYERQKQQQMKYTDNDNNSDTNDYNYNMNNYPTIITMGIDLGTCYMKIASTTYVPSSPITLQISREGDRSIFNGVVYNDYDYTDSSNTDTDIDIDSKNTRRRVVKATGRAALERYYYPLYNNNSNTNTKDIVLLPFVELTSSLTNENANDSSNIVTDVLQERLLNVLDRIHSSILSSSMSQSNSVLLLRHVITVPCLLLQSNIDDKSSMYKAYQKLFQDCCTTYKDPNLNNFQMEYHMTYIPEPVATVWGAQYHDILPSSLSSSKSGSASLLSFCIVDVGSLITQISIVQNDRLLYSSTIPYGGENIIEQLVLLLLKTAVQDNNHTFELNDSRSLSLLQYHARQAVMELSQQSRVSVHVPYLYDNPKQHHMDTTIARDVLNYAIDDNIKQLLSSIQRSTATTNEKSVNSKIDASSAWIPDSILSPHLPIPNSLTSLFTSILTQVIEHSGVQLPSNISAVLLVGGGCKNGYIQKSIHDAWDILTGGMGGGDHIIRTIEPSLQAEITAIGAATLPPSFDYSLKDGLVHRK